MKLNRIMIVTGENTRLHLLPPLLESLGYSCRQMIKADDALKQLLLYPADIIIINHHLPEIDGIAISDKFLSQKHIGEPKVIILKSDPLNRLEVKSLQRGAHTVINSSYSLQSLISAITPCAKRN